MSIQANQPSSTWRKIYIESVAGGGASAIAVAAIQPMITKKMLRQQHSGTTTLQKTALASGSRFAHLAHTARFYYKGGAGLAGSFIPTTALQTGANELYSSLGLGPIAAPAAAGASSALFACPAEQIMTYQKQQNLSWTQAVVRLYTRHGASSFFRALQETAVREALFTAGYVWMAPYLKRKLEEVGASPIMATAGSITVSGAVAATCSHTVDTRKTIKQIDFAAKEPLLQLFSKRALAGLGWRIPMVITAIGLISTLKGPFKSQVEDLSDSFKNMKV